MQLIRNNDGNDKASNELPISSISSSKNESEVNCFETFSNSTFSKIKLYQMLPSPFEIIYPNGIILNQNTIELFERNREAKVALTFDEVTLEDKPTNLHPNEVELSSFVTRKIQLKGCGILSAAMDTVTECGMALAMAKIGGLGVLHSNLSPEIQSDMIKWVRRKIHCGGMIDKPITFHPNDRYSFLQKEILVQGWSFTSFPVVDDHGVLLGLITRDEIDFVEEGNPLLSEIMKPKNQIVTALAGTNSEEAYGLMQRRKVKKLPIITENGNLVGMYVWNDVRRDQKKRKLFSLDENGNFLVVSFRKTLIFD